MGFEFAYTAWGLRIGFRASEHIHDHYYNEETHTHLHHHLGHHVHIHGDLKSVTPWALFVIFVLGPWKPLDPVVMFRAAQCSWGDRVWVTIDFGVTTIATMTSVIMVTSRGLIHVNFGFLECYVHDIAGVIIALSGLMIKLFRL